MPSKRRALRRPVARRAAAVHLAGHHHERHFRSLVVHGRVEQRAHLAGGEVARPAALLPLGQLVLQLHVGEGAAHHHLVVAAARAVGVEVGRSHAALLQVAGRGRVGGNGTRRRDVVGGDEVAQQRQRASGLNGLRRGGLALHAVEVRGAAHVGGRVVPAERVAGFAAQRGPGRIAVVQAARALLVQGSGSHAAATSAAISSSLGQMSAKSTGVPSGRVPSASCSRSASMVPASA